MTTISTREVLEEAITILETGGWIQGTYDDGRSHCAVGALVAAAQGLGAPCEKTSACPCAACTSIFYPSVTEAKRAILSHAPGYCSVEQWNDSLGRTSKDVEQTFKLAIKTEIQREERA